MRPTLLIAGNFLRENRWPVLLLILWGVGSGVAGALTVGSSLDDALFFLKQQAVYSVFFTVFLSTSALYNQRRSRRILAVLSKGIERYEYLSGIVVGFSAVSFFYSIALGLTGAWTFMLAGFPATNVLPLAVMLLLASIMAGTVALFYSTFMNPLFALLATSLTLGLSAVFGKHIPSLLPAYTLHGERDGLHVSWGSAISVDGGTVGGVGDGAAVGGGVGDLRAEGYCGIGGVSPFTTETQRHREEIGKAPSTGSLSLVDAIVIGLMPWRIEVRIRVRGREARRGRW